MAIARVQSKKYTSGATASLTHDIVLTSTPTDGNIIVLVAGSSAALMTITSTSGITWLYTNRTGASSANVLIAVGRVFSGASATITVGLNTSVPLAMVAAEYSGTNIRPDRASSATATSAAPASGATSTTSNANELFIGGISVRNTNGVTFSSPTDGFSIVDQELTSAGTTNDRGVCLLEKIVTSTGTPNPGATSSASGVWVAGCITFEEVASSSGGMMVPTAVLGAEGFRIGA